MLPSATHLKCDGDRSARHRTHILYVHSDDSDAKVVPESLVL